MEVVREDRAGKWYLEPRNPFLTRQQVKILEAARMAVWGERHANGKIMLGLSGGKTFDRYVKAQRDDHGRRN